MAWRPRTCRFDTGQQPVPEEPLLRRPRGGGRRSAWLVAFLAPELAPDTPITKWWQARSCAFEYSVVPSFLPPGKVRLASGTNRQIYYGTASMQMALVGATTNGTMSPHQLSQNLLN